MADASKVPDKLCAGLQALGALIPRPFLPMGLQKPECDLVVATEGRLLDAPG